MRALAFALLPLLALPLLGSPSSADEPRIDVTELENGLDLIVVEKHDAAIVTIEVAVRTGSFTETPATNGLSHLYEHMFFKGNAALPTQERYMARKSALGAQFNGTTSTERVNYFITLPSRNFAAGMKFMADALLTPLFNEDELVAEREIVRSEYDRNESQPGWYVGRAMRTLMYGDEGYRKSALGERDIILSASRQTMLDFRAKYYVPNNSALLVVGDVNLTEARALAEELFGVNQWRAGEDPHWPPRAPLPRLRESRAAIVTEPAGVMDNVKVMSLSIHQNGPDVPRDERATFVADVWGTLCGIRHGRFQKAFRDTGIARGGASLHYYTQREGGEVQFSCAVKDGQVQACRDAFLAETAAMGQAGYWTEEDLALARRTLRIDRAYAAEKGVDLSHNLSFWWASSSIDYYRRYLSECDSVTLEEVQQFVRNYLIGRPMAVVLAGSRAEVEKHGITEAQLLPPDGASAAAAGVEELTLQNGIRVILRREAGGAVSALDVGFAGGSATIPEGKEGVDLLLLQAVMQGSRTTSRDALQAEMARLGANHGADSNFDYSRLSVVAPGEGFPRAVQLLAECLREPLLDPAVVQQLKDTRLAALDQEATQPDQSQPRLVNTILFAGHPYARRPDGTRESVEKLDPEALRARLRELLVSGRLLLVLVSDLERQAALKLLEASFGFVPRGEWARPELPPFRPERRVVQQQRPLPGTYLYAKLAVPPPGHPDFAAMRACVAVLDDRFWTTLRTKHSVTYAPGAGTAQYRTNFAVMICGNAKDPRRGLELMHEEVRRLQTELVPQEELQGAVAGEETGASSRNESAASHANGLTHAQLVSGSWRLHYDLPPAILRVTPEDVQRVAREYLKDMTWAVLGPEALPEDLLLGPASARR